MPYEAIKQIELRVGQKVYYQPDHYRPDQWGNGIIKEIPVHTAESVRVVYNCAGDWMRFRDYTSALTNIRDIKIGWKY